MAEVGVAVGVAVGPVGVPETARPVVEVVEDEFEATEALIN